MELISVGELVQRLGDIGEAAIEAADGGLIRWPPDGLSELIQAEDEVDPLEQLTVRSRGILQRWRAGYSAAEIAQAYGGIVPKTVHNEISSLRSMLGSDLVPYDRDRRRMLRKWEVDGY